MVDCYLYMDYETTVSSLNIRWIYAKNCAVVKFYLDK